MRSLFRTRYVNAKLIPRRDWHGGWVGRFHEEAHGGVEEPLGDETPQCRDHVSGRGGGIVVALSLFVICCFGV